MSALSNTTEEQRTGDKTFRETAKRAEVRPMEFLQQEINSEIHKAIGNAK